MKSAKNRKNRRRRSQEITLFILSNEPSQSMRYADLSLLVSESMRASISPSSLGQLCRGLLKDGTIEREMIYDHGTEHLIWKLNPLLDKPKLETDNT